MCCWVYCFCASLSEIDIILSSSPFCNNLGTYCSARDCILDPKKTQRGWGRMHRMGMKLPWLCAFVLKSCWESFRPLVRSLARQPGSMNVPKYSPFLRCRLLMKLVLSVRKSRTLENIIRKNTVKNNDKIENKSCQSPRIYLASACCVCLFP